MRNAIVLTLTSVTKLNIVDPGNTYQRVSAASGVEDSMLFLSQTRQALTEHRRVATNVDCAQQIAS